MKIEPKKFPRTPPQKRLVGRPLKGLPKTLFEKALSQLATAVSLIEKKTFEKVRFLNRKFNYEELSNKYDFYDSVCKHTIFCEEKKN